MRVVPRARYDIRERTNIRCSRRVEGEDRHECAQGGTAARDTEKPEGGEYELDVTAKREAGVRSVLVAATDPGHRTT